PGGARRGRVVDGRCCGSGSGCSRSPRTVKPLRVLERGSAPLPLPSLLPGSNAPGFHGSRQAARCCGPQQPRTGAHLRLAPGSRWGWS
ncbi:hypothetical protein Q9966_004744, partial [Columba livia]